LLLDRAAFPSDTLSVHYIHQPGVACLKRWGLLDEVIRSNCPPVRTLALDVGPFVLAGPPAAADGVADGYAPRRTILDTILVEAAAGAGAEVRQRFVVDGLLTDGDRVVGIRGHDIGGATVEERAAIVIGADGMHSVVARSVGASSYNEKPSLTCAYYSYWDGMPRDDAARLYVRVGNTIVFGPTNDGLSLLIVYWPRNRFDEVRTAIEGRFLEALQLAPALAERARHGRRVEPFRGTGDLPNFFRTPFGPGWALVGDAGYHKDPITALGISDAFRDAEWLARAVHEGLSGGRRMEEALAEYQRRRDEFVLPLYEVTCQQASLQAPPPEMQALLSALRTNPEATSRFFGTMTGAVPIPEFFAPENMRRILGAAA
jgi:flavin-dependent dehydrogenase